MTESHETNKEHRNRNILDRLFAPFGVDAIDRHIKEGGTKHGAFIEGNLQMWLPATYGFFSYFRENPKERSIGLLIPVALAYLGLDTMIDLFCVAGSTIDPVTWLAVKYVYNLVVTNVSYSPSGNEKSPKQQKS
jgi:hypothetical protein